MSIFYFLFYYSLLSYVLLLKNKVSNLIIGYNYKLIYGIITYNRIK